MTYEGQRLSVSEFLELARAEPQPPPDLYAHVGLRHTAASNASCCADLMAEGDGPDELWRYIILQSLDDYTSTLRRGGTQLAARFFDEEPRPTGSPHIDAALAALADYLATRDGWQTPAWAQDPTRTVDAWYPDIRPSARSRARTESPKAFRQRGIYITSLSLQRA